MEINVDYGSLAYIWLGNEALLIKTNSHYVLFDPSDRITVSNLRFRVDFIFITKISHESFYEEILSELFVRRSRWLIVPAETYETFSRMNGRTGGVLGVKPGDRITVDNIHAIVFPSSARVRGIPVTYFLELDGISFYYGGGYPPTYSSMNLNLLKGRTKIAFLSVGYPKLNVTEAYNALKAFQPRIAVCLSDWSTEVNKLSSMLGSTIIVVQAVVYRVTLLDKQLT